LLAQDAWPESDLKNLYSGSVSLVCVPALFGLGTPHWNATAAADFLGLTVDSTPEEVCGAALLGVVHQVVDALEAVANSIREPLSVVRVDGGMGRNGSILQCIADLARVTVEWAVETEATALGAACLAGLGVGEWDIESLGRIPFPRGARLVPAIDESARAATRLRWAKSISTFIERETRAREL
jgi:glycerol kinase